MTTGYFSIFFNSFGVQFLRILRKSMHDLKEATKPVSDMK